MFSQDTLDEISRRIPLIELVAEFVSLQTTGKNSRGLCPFHQEKTPSFFVNPERESFHCYGCGAGGNLFHFYMKIEGLSFPEAVQRLAEKAGIILKDVRQVSPELSEKRRRALELMRHAAWYYHCLLKSSPNESVVAQYLKRRKITQEDCQSFVLGYCPPHQSGLLSYLRKKGFSSQEIEASHLFKGSREFFRSRLLFPIFNEHKKIVAFGGRLVEEKDFGPKYLNSPESDLFKKSEIFYAWHLAKETVLKKKRIFITEGYLDVIAMHRHGFSEAIAPLGTSISPSQARKLKQKAADVVLVFDGDAAGQKAARRALEVFLRVGLVPQWIKLEPGEDPDSFLQRFGRLAFEKKAENTRNLLEDLIDNGSDPKIKSGSNLAKKGEIVSHLIRLIDQIPDDLTRNLYRRYLAQSWEVPEAWLEQSKKIQPTTNNFVKAKLPLLAAETIIFEVWLKSPGLRDQIMAEISPNQFYSPLACELAKKFWEIAKPNDEASVSKFLECVPEECLSAFSQLSLEENSMDKESVAQRCLTAALLQLREHRLRQGLKGFESNQDTPSIDLLEARLKELSDLLKNKERLYGES